MRLGSALNFEVARTYQAQTAPDIVRFGRPFTASLITDAPKTARKLPSQGLTFFSQLGSR